MAIDKRRHDDHHLRLIVAWVFLFSYFSLTAGTVFQYFKLVIQWPKSFCKPDPHICTRQPIPTNFTIHGLWPDNYGQSLYNCTLPAKVKKLGLRSSWLRLDASWTDLKKPYSGGQDHKFWLLQYEKHGSCSYPLYSVQNYFLKALDLKDRFDVLRILELDGMIPGNGIPREQVKTAISQVTGHSPILVCRDNTLREIAICFAPTQISVIPCPGSTHRGCTETIDFPS